MTTPELYYQVSDGSQKSPSYLTLTEINATSRKLLQQVLGSKPYVRNGDDFQLYDDWCSDREWMLAA